jgi:hypothetical protein
MEIKDKLRLIRDDIDKSGFSLTYETIYHTYGLCEYPSCGYCKEFKVPNGCPRNDIFIEYIKDR